MFNDDLFLTRHGHFLTNWTQKKCIFRMRAVKRVGLQARKMVCVDTLKNCKFKVSVLPEIFAADRADCPARTGILKFFSQLPSKRFFHDGSGSAQCASAFGGTNSVSGDAVTPVMLDFHGYTRTGKTADKQRSKNSHFQIAKKK